MWFARKSDSLFPESAAPALHAANRTAEDPARAAEPAEDAPQPRESGVVKTLGWVSAALGAVALGLIVGRELRQRYKFNRRTPYDLYAHSGDGTADLSEMDFGVGI